MVCSARWFLLGPAVPPGTGGVLMARQIVESTLASQLISLAVSILAGSLVRPLAQTPSRCQRRRTRSPSATDRTPMAGSATAHRSAPVRTASESRRSIAAAPPTACPAPRPATTAPAPPTRHLTDALAPHPDHHGTKREVDRSSKTRPSTPAVDRDHAEAAAWRR